MKQDQPARLLFTDLWEWDSTTGEYFIPAEKLPKSKPVRVPLWLAQRMEALGYGRILSEDEAKLGPVPEGGQATD
jgi:hypothetical protein